jgi:hypothetical protein
MSVRVSGEIGLTVPISVFALVLTARMRGGDMANPILSSPWMKRNAPVFVSRTWPMGWGSSLRAFSGQAMTQAPQLWQRSGKIITCFFRRMMALNMQAVLQEPQPVHFSSATRGMGMVISSSLVWVSAPFWVL